MDGSDSTTPRCWASLTALNCGRGFRSSWVASASPATFPTLPMAWSLWRTQLIQRCGACRGNFWSSRKNGTRGTNRHVPMCMYSPAWMRVRTHPTPRRRWEIIPSCGRTNTTRQETFTSLWGIIRSCSTIQRSRLCFRTRYSGPRTNAHPADANTALSDQFPTQYLLKPM